jgi:hypothetical protein
MAPCVEVPLTYGLRQNPGPNLWTAADAEPQAVDCVGIELETEPNDHALRRAERSPDARDQCPCVALDATIRAPKGGPQACGAGRVRVVARPSHARGRAQM